MQHEMDWYDGSIRAMDTELGRIIETLQELAIASKTVLAFIGDHGEEFLDHGGHWHDNVYGENYQRTPRAVWAPERIANGTVISETVRSIDLMPTLLELSGLPIPEAAQGRSLLPLLLSNDSQGRSALAGEREAWRRLPAFTELLQADRAPKDSPELETFAVVDGGWKLVHNELEPAGAPEWQLFDHLNGPLNQFNVSEQHLEIVERLQRLLSDWQSYAEAARLPPDAESVEGMSAEELERLRSLGYIQ